MYTTYHLSSAQDVNTEILDAIRAAFKTRPIVITIEDETDATAYLMSSPANRKMLDESLLQARNGNFVEVKVEDL